MAKQANRMMIGGFVVLALIIMVGSLVVFGSGKFFQKTVKCVLFFDESVKGLSVGAPVLFRGVQIGSVASIVLKVDPAKLQTQIPVIIEFDPENFRVSQEGQEIPRDPRTNIPKLVEKGLRAQLQMQSLITGQLLIEINFHPDTPLSLKGFDKHHIEIPTIPSTSERLAEALGDLDLKGIEKHLLSALTAVDRFLNNPDLLASLRALKDTLQDARKLVTRVDRQVDPVTGDLKKTLKDIGKLSNNIDSRVEGVTTGFDKTMSSARGVISAESPLMVELENTLKEISTMSRAIRQLAAYLDEHPESLLRGKKDSGKKDSGKKSSGGK